MTPAPTLPHDVAAGTPVVRLRPVDATDVADLYRWRMDDSARPMFRRSERVPFASHEQLVAQHLAAHRGDRWYVIEADGLAVGAIALYDIAPAGDEAEWGRFVIDPAHRRRGIGRAALRLLMAEARAAGVRRLRCEVLAGNEAERLYRRLGFADAGEELVDGRRFVRLVADLEGG